MFRQSTKTERARLLYRYEAGQRDTILTGQVTRVVHVTAHAHTKSKLPVRFYGRIFVDPGDPGDPVVRLLHKPVRSSSYVPGGPRLVCGKAQLTGQ